MKIKHFSGYGTVNAFKKQSKKKDNFRYVIVEVQDNHEMGLERPFFDPYTIHNWIGKRFAKGHTDLDLLKYEVFFRGNKEIDGVNTDYAMYSLIYREG